MFDSRGAEANKLGHPSGVTRSTDSTDSTNSADKHDNLASALWKGAVGESSQHAGRVASCFAGGGVAGVALRALLPKASEALVVTGVSVAAVGGYAILRHGAEWFHDAKVVAGSGSYSKGERESAENDLQHLGARAADTVVAALGLATGRAVSSKLLRSSSTTVEAESLPKVDFIHSIDSAEAKIALPSAKAELPLSLAEAEVPVSVAKKEVEAIAPPLALTRFVEPPPAPLGSKEHAVRTLISQATDMSFVSKMERGTNGAYLIKDKDGVDHIFKLVSPNDVTPQIYNSAKASAAVDSLVARTPTYEEVKYTPGHGTWYMQELLPGIPAPVPSDRLIGQMMKLNDRQAENAIVGSENWNQKIMSALHDDANGWKKRIARTNQEGADLVGRVESFVAGASHDLRSGDIVHGDFQHYNALVSPSDRLTGYVDWEGAGAGDRSIDVSRLLYDAYVAEKEAGYRANPETLRMLAGKINEISGPSAVRSHMGFWILQVADFGAKMGTKDLAKFASVGRRIISDLDTKEFSLAS
jgi:hypothetical protein